MSTEAQILANPACRGVASGEAGSSLGIFTLVKNPLQITCFYAKQTQFPKKSNDVNPYNTTDYERKRDWTLGENKPNLSQFKPIKANFKPNFKPNQSQF